MRNKCMEPIRLEGETVILEEIAPKYFPYVVAWRNNPDLNKYLNQPFVLTEELEQKWYEEIYLPDDTQGFLILIDKAMNTPIGTLGWANMDIVRRRCTLERLLLGDNRFRTAASFFESFFVCGDFLYRSVDTIYCHVAVGNQKAMRLNNMLGFQVNQGEIQYPRNLLICGLVQQELFRTKEMYEKTKQHLSVL